MVLDAGLDAWVSEGLHFILQHAAWLLVVGPVAGAATIILRPSQPRDPMAVMTSASSLPYPRRNGPADFLARAESRAALRSLAKQRGMTVGQLRKSAREIPIGEEHIMDSSGNAAVVETWDWIMEWNDRCIAPTELQTWRQLSDPLVDDALSALQNLEEKDGRHMPGASKMEVLERLVSATSKASSQKSPEVLAIRKFLDSVSRRPPRGAGALSESWYSERDARWSHRWSAAGGKGSVSDALEKLDDQSSSVGFNDDQRRQLEEALQEELKQEHKALAEAQKVFYTFFGPILLSLLHFSLAGGFSSPRITNVLRQTGYLVPGVSKATITNAVEESKQAMEGSEEPAAGLVAANALSQASADRTWRRLMETTQFVADVMETVDALTPPATGEDPATSGGAGWQSAVRVRLLHGSVRARIMRTLASSGYSLEQDGVPINQEDMAATLSSFCSAPLWSVSRMGIALSVLERDALVALWRHVGFYMGVEPRFLKRCFHDASTADGLLFSTVRHLFGSEEILRPSPTSGVKGEIQQALSGPTIPVLTACANRPPFFTPLEVHFALARHLLGDNFSSALGVPQTSLKRRILVELSFLSMHLPVTFGRLYPRRGWEEERLRLARPLLRRVIVFSLDFRKTRFGYGGLPAGRSHDEVGEEGEKVERDIKLIQQIMRGWRLLIVEAVVVSGIVAVSAGTLFWFGLKALL